MEFIKIINLIINHQGTKLFVIPHLKISTNEKIGLIGENGAGKTTLMRAIVQMPEAAHGQIIKNCSLVYVPQLLPQTDCSGGEKEKATLEAAFHQLKGQTNSVLLLDEPTSNLDETEQKWLITKLQSLTCSLLVISHDRQLLNAVTNRIWELKNQQITAFTGNFAAYEQHSTREKATHEVQVRQHELKRKRLQKEYQHKQSQGHTARKRKAGISTSDWKSRGDATGTERKLLRQSRILAKKIAAEAAAVKQSYKRQPITLKNITADLSKLNLPAKANLISIKPQNVSWQKQELFKITHELRLQANSKIVLTGPNGSGKSVFLKQLAGQHLTGFYNQQLSIGHFNQDLTASLSQETVLHQILQESIFARSSTMQLLGDLHLQVALNEPITKLSGGQLVCFNLAQVLLGRHNFLLLDEPTNFLDISAITALTNFIKNYPFALIVVSHDQKFIADLNLPNWKIKNGLLLNGAYLQSNSNQNQEKIALLKFKRDQMIGDPTATLTQIKEITQQLQELTR
ncbi:ATP-binding cassette domain-containing protein [Lactobacillus sp. ESL0731]|uniref:ATP-binding cassette domain-containing protein n=1 Tax=unclassified Lactobacillus TaxID=2620435 RepID=UPI0023F6D233|nr:MULTISPECIES: ATP-binding cassette domain-containing protein [unclassified Lactobacillus]WEV50284.1 ATP-binding cassette domain-containing protein [Lactobacillus sp. ESL0700]WEV61413.1 ATP-binding cassette domain-containing protein [Lactobacillus sp. ESL0731]